MIDWDTLRIVLSVHRMGGLAGASRDLQVSQPTVSRHIARAESDLTCKLFDRRQGRLVATEAGLIVIREAERVEARLHTMQEAVRQIDNGMSGTISISAPQQLLPYCVADEIRDFQRLYPDITFDLSISNQLAEVRSGAIDIVFRAEENPKPSYWGKRIAELGHGYYGHADLLDALGYPDRDLTTAPAVPLIVHVGVTGSSQEEAKILFPDGVTIARSHSLEATVALIDSGMGIGRVPHIIARSRPDLRPVAGLGTPSPRSLWILTHKDMRSIQRIETFIEFVADQMKEKSALFSSPGASLP